MSAFNHFTDAVAVHHLSKADASGIIGAAAYSSTHVCINRKPLRFHQDLAGDRQPELFSYYRPPILALLPFIPKNMAENY